MLLNIFWKNDVSAECQVTLACQTKLCTHLREEWDEQFSEGISSSIFTLNIHS